MAAERNIIGLRRGLTVLAFLAARPDGAGFSGLRRALGSPTAATTSRVLKVLLDEDWLRKDGDRYFAGKGFVLAARTLTGSADAGELVQPVVDALAADTQQSAAYFELRNDRTTLLAKCDRANSFHYIPVGRGQRLFTVHAWAHVLLAYRGRDEVERLFARREENRSLPKREFMQRIDAARDADAYVYLRGGVYGALARVVAPVFPDAEHRNVGAIGITSITDLDEPALEALKQRVAAAGRAATDRLQRAYRNTNH